jgi:hypothetical protein
MAVSEKALELILRQPSQWQAAVTIGAADISISVLPQRQDPTSGFMEDSRSGRRGGVIPAGIVTRIRLP